MTTSRPRHTRHGDHDQSDHNPYGGGGSGPQRMSSDEWADTYADMEVSRTSFGDAGGTITSMDDGTVQIAFEDNDSVTVMADLSQNDADNLSSELNTWQEVDQDGYYDEDTGELLSEPDPSTGLIDHSAVAGTDLVVGVNEDFQVSIISTSDPSVRIDLASEGDASAFSESLFSETANAYNAESTAYTTDTRSARAWNRLLARAAPYLNLPHLRYSDDQERDPDGKFGSGGGGGGGDDDDSGGGDDNPYGDGKDVSEHDVDDNGEPRFSQSYREQYGSVESEQQLGGSSTSLVTTESGSIHIADDSGGTQDREVVQEFTPGQAAAAGDAVFEANSEGGSHTGGGVTAEASGEAERDGTYPVQVTFANGSSVSLGSDDAFELQEGLILSSGETRSAARSRITRYLNLPELSSTLRAE